MAVSNPIEQYLDQRILYWQSIDRFSKPLIAVVDGFCLGGGMELAMSCDLILASDKAQFGQPEINLGLIPGGGGTQRLPKLIGKSKAMSMVLTGEFIDAPKAYEWNIVSQVFPSSTLLRESFEVAKKISASMRLESHSAFRSETAVPYGSHTETTLAIA